MLLNDIENKDELINAVVSELRSHGIKYRKDKRIKNAQDKTKCKRIFHMPLHTLELTDVILTNGGIAQIPLFVSDASQRILEQVNTEGLFRKAGSTKRQQDIKASLETGQPLGKNHHVIDVANILKTFFRDLPEPLLPAGNMQEALLRCLLSGENKIYDLMMTCLLLPPLTLNTLAFFLQFLHTVSLHSNLNKMTIENLAIILTPNVMPIAELIQQRLNSHVKVVQLLIENSHKIGIVPEMLLDKYSETLNIMRPQNKSVLQHTDKKKKKRRSGSLTRMFIGLRKMVGAIGSTESLDRTTENNEKEAMTPCLNKSAKKRKVTDGNPFSAKKKKDVLSHLPDRDLLPCTPALVIKEHKKSRLSLGGGKKHAKINRLVPSTSVTSIIDSKPMERRWSVVGAPWGARKKQREKIDEEKPICALSPVFSLPCLVSPVKESKLELLPAPKCLFQDEDDEEEKNEEYEDFVKSEYEAIKERVHAIETRISREFGHVLNAESVQNKYEETLEETEPIEATSSTTDQLAKRLSRELKIRRSAEHKVIRSPSARKIGTMRRRSRENVRLSRNQSWHIGGNASNNPESFLQFYPKISNLKRGRPNTLQTGLKHPDLSPVKKSPEQQQNVSSNENWVSANAFFSQPENDPHEISMDVVEIPSTPSKSSNVHEDIFKTPELPTPRRTSLRSGGNSRNTTPHFVTKIELGEIKTPMLPPNIPPRKTPAKTPMLPPKTPGKTLSEYPALINKTLLTPLQELQTGRASIARIRSQNAGMVMAKAKLFDGLVTESGNCINRRQSTRFAIKKNMPVVEVKQIQKIKTNNSTKSPRKSTPRRKYQQKSPHHGGVNRRQQLRLAKTPGNALDSPKLNRILKKQNENLFSPTLYDYNDTLMSPGAAHRTPHIKKPLMRNSPRRILKTPNNNRQHTPMKATPISVLTLGIGGGNERRQSPRLGKNYHQRTNTSSNTFLMRP